MNITANSTNHNNYAFTVLENTPLGATIGNLYGTDDDKEAAGELTHKAVYSSKCPEIINPYSGT